MKKETKKEKDRFFYYGQYRNGLGDYTSFQPILGSLKKKDYLQLAEKYSKRVTHHTVYADREESKPWAEALMEFSSDDGHHAVVAALSVSSGQQIRKMVNRMLTDMDRGLVKQSPVTSITIFKLGHYITPGSLNYFFQSNADFDDFGSF